MYDRPDVSMAWILVPLVALALLLASLLVLLARRLQQARDGAARVEARLAAVLAAAGAGLSVWSAAGRMVACNARFGELYPDVPIKPGLELEDLIRFTATRGLVQIPDEEVEAWVQARLAGVREGKRDVVRTAAGRWLEMGAAPADDGETLLLYSDVTDAEEARAGLSEHARQLARRAADLELLQGAAASAAGGPLEAAVPEVVALICSWAGWPVGRGWRVVGDDPLRCEPLPGALVVAGEEFERLRPLLAAEAPPDGDSLVARAVRARRVAWVANVEGDPAFQSGGRTALHGIRGACGVPVTCGEQVVAVLEFLSREQLAPAAATTRLLDSVGRMLGAAAQRSAYPRLAHDE